MLKETPFYESDLVKIKVLPERFKVYSVIFILFTVPLSFVFGLAGLLRKGFGYWPTTIAFLSVFTVSLLIIIIKRYLAYRKDLSKRIKFSGEIRVKKKKEDKKEMILYFDSKHLKKHQIYSKTTFDAIHEDDILTTEFSKYSKHLFCLKKDDSSLLEEAESD